MANPLSSFNRGGTQGGWAGEIRVPRYTTPRITVAPRHKPKGIPGFVENLAGDIRDTLMGIPTGIVLTARAGIFDTKDAFGGDFDFEHTRKIGTEIGKSYAHTYGPLFKGDFDTFGDRVFDHPLAPMLDVLSVATLGAGGAVKGASLLAKAGKASGVKLDKVKTPAHTVMDWEQGAPIFRIPTDQNRLDSAHPGQRAIGDGRNLPDTPGRSQEPLSAPPVHTPKVGTTQIGRERLVPEERTSTFAGKVISGLERVGNPHVRRELDVASPIVGFKHYSTNPMIRLRQKTVENVMDDIALIAPRWFGGSEKVAAGRAIGHAADWKRHQRWLYKQHSYRHAATRAMADMQMGAIMALGKDLHDRPDQVAKLVEWHAGTQMHTHAYKVHEDKLLDADGKLMLPEGFHFLRADPREGRRAPGYDQPVGDWNDWIKSIPQRYTTNKWAQALKDKDGNFHLVQNRMVNPWIDELIKGSNAARYLYRYPTTVWKWMVLGLSPRYLVNNAVGNTFMYLMAAGGPRGIRGFVDAVRQVKGERAAEQMMRDALRYDSDDQVQTWAESVEAHVVDETPYTGSRELEVRDQLPDFPNLRVEAEEIFSRTIPGEKHGIKLPRKAARLMGSGDWQSKWYLGLHQGFGREVMESMKIQDRFGVQSARFVKVAGQGLYPLTHYLTDVLIRRSAINTLIRQVPEYRTHYKSFRDSGYSRKDAHNMAGDKASESAAVRDLIQERVNDMLGDYHHLTGWEQALRTIIPFYTWDRAIARHSVRLSLDKPTRASLLVRTGAMGQAANAELFGEHMPKFLQSIIPGELLGFDKTTHSGRRSGIISTGLNPYSTIPGLIDVARAMTGGGSYNVDAGESIGSQLNPFVVGVIENLTGTSLLSGRRIERSPGGIIGDITQRTFKNTPLPRAWGSTFGERPLPQLDEKGRIRSPLLYRGDREQQLSSLFGVPIRRVSPDKASELYRREHGYKKAKLPGKPPEISLAALRRKGESKKAPRRRRQGIRRLTLDTKPKRFLKTG